MTSKVTDPDDTFNPPDQPRYIRTWYPPGVTEAQVLWGGSMAKVAQLEDGTVLKYIRDLDDDSAKRCLLIEHHILTALGNHERVIEYLGKQEHGLRFRKAHNGDVCRYILARRGTGQITQRQRGRWVNQAAIGLAFIHEKGVIHCDIHPNNLLLDENLDLKFCDFGGSVFEEWDGEAMESLRYCSPRDPPFTPTVRSDIFALGSAMYFIMSGHDPYDDRPDDEVRRLFSRNIFPDVTEYYCGSVIEGCWKGSFDDVQQVVNCLSKLETPVLRC